MGFISHRVFAIAGLTAKNSHSADPVCIIRTLYWGSIHVAGWRLLKTFLFL